MQSPLEITFRRVPRTEGAEALIRRKASALERICPEIVGCRVVVDSPQAGQRSGRSFRVVVKTRVPPGKELVTRRDASGGEIHEELSTVIRAAFGAMRRQLKTATGRRDTQEFTPPPESGEIGYIHRLFDDHGFIKTPLGREVYFHRNAVTGRGFDRLETGTGVRFEEAPGDEGPQASTVRILDKPGARIDRVGEPGTEPPLGWH